MAVGPRRSAFNWREVMMIPQADIDPLRRPHTPVYLEPSGAFIGILTTVVLLPPTVRTIVLEAIILTAEGKAIKADRYVARYSRDPRAIFVQSVPAFLALLRRYKGLWAADL